MAEIFGLAMIELFGIVVSTLLTICLAYLRQIAKYSKQNHRYLHGDDSNPHHDGILDLVETLVERVEKLSERIAKLEKEVFGDNNDKQESKSD